MVCNTVQEIKLGEAEVVLTGGAESMSQAPFTVRNMRFGTTLGQDLKVCVSFHNTADFSFWGKFFVSNSEECKFYGT